MTIVRVPGSSANLGPGFDGLGMALGLYADVGVVGVDDVPERGKVADEHHPATIAFRSAGGNGDVWVRSEIPMGRGLGFSGAVRVGGAVLGVLQSRHAASLDVAMTQTVIDVTARLEGHADNVAASLLGGVVGTNGRRAVKVPSVAASQRNWSSSCGFPTSPPLRRSRARKCRGPCPSTRRSST